MKRFARWFLDVFFWWSACILTAVCLLMIGHMVFRAVKWMIGL